MHRPTSVIWRIAVKKLGLSLMLVVAGLVVSSLVSCSGFDNSKSNQPAQIQDAGGNTPDSSSDGSNCTPIQGQPLPARLAVMSADAGAPTGTPVFVDDVFSRFNSTCGGCHVAANQGNYQLTRGT